MSPPIQVITFDLWDTVVVDDSDEAKRTAMSLPSKREQRRLLLWEALQKHAGIERDAVFEAYDHVDSAFNAAWHDEHVTWKIGDRLQRVLDHLGASVPDDDFQKVVFAHEEMEVEIAPDLIEGCAEALGELASQYRLAIVSDAIVSPGHSLRRVLDGHGVLGYFQAFAFSDEVGRSKPHPDMFETVARQLNVPIESMIHIGDREHNDVNGAQKLGMKAILFTGSRSIDLEGTKADAVCDCYADLPALVEKLSSKTGAMTDG